MEKDNGDEPKDEGLHIFGQEENKEQCVAILIQAKDDGNDLMRIFRQSPGLADVEVDPDKCDIIFRLEIGGKVVINIRLKEK